MKMSKTADNHVVPVGEDSLDLDFEVGKGRQELVPDPLEWFDALHIARLHVPDAFRAHQLANGVRTTLVPDLLEPPPG
jgi:hypothetical protein